MANQIVLADTSLFIDFFRKSDKSKSQLLSLVRRGYKFCISTITEYELYIGAKDEQITYWNDFFEKVEILNFDSKAAFMAVEINKGLKYKSKQIDLADLFIAAIAVSNSLPLATLNLKHFERIDELSLLDLT